LLATLFCLLILAFVGWSISAKERLLRDGRTVYLELAPVDPRSIMQGDYMALNYVVAGDIRSRLPRPEEIRWGNEVEARDGRALVQVDARGVAQFVSLDEGVEPAADQVYMRYRIRNDRLKFASNAYFFQEGTAADYQGARYGRFAVAADGEVLLVALHDENLDQLGAR
jgi:uncharacterized membrane-anchored protein